MIKRNNLVYNISSINEYGVDKNINQPIQVVVKDVILINDYKLKIIYSNGATKDIELVNNSIKNFEYVIEGNKIIIETNNNDKFEIEIPIDGSKWELVEGLLRTKDSAKITLHDISEIDSDLGGEDEFLNKKGEFVTPSHSALENKNSEASFQHVDTTKEVELFDKLAVFNAENELVTSSLDNINKTEKKVTKFGRLYSVPTAKNPNLVGQGFRLPSIEDWETLIGVRDGTNVYSTEYLKYLSTNPDMWSVVSAEATNEHNFNIVAGGTSPHSEQRAFTGLLTFANYHTSSVTEENANIWLYFRIEQVVREFSSAPAQYNSIRFCRALTASEATYNDGAILEPYTDFEGYKYEVRKIGNLAWMCENLMTEYYLDGTKLIANQEEYGVDEVRAYDDLTSNVYSFKAVDKDVAKPILYEELFALLKAGDLSTGMQYLITDYTTTTVQTDTQSAGHNFDIIVTALSNNELSETARCVKKADDTYFANANLEAWEIKYCINNDVNRFAWADAVNGKGVIYYMKDEWNNEFPYDFKNIQFKKSDVFLYTFGGTTDDSLTRGCHHNTMMNYTSSSVLKLNFNTFGTSCYSNTFGNNCYNNTLGNSCHSNTFGNDCYSNTFSKMCWDNTFGNDCYSNTFSKLCWDNTFGSKCQGNIFGDNCVSNKFGYSCSSNTFDRYAYYTKFGNSCSYNTFGPGGTSITFGDKCNYNSFGRECSYITFGNVCEYNNFYAGTSGTTKKDYIKCVVLEDLCRNNNFYSTLTTSGTAFLYRIRISGCQNDNPTNIQILLPSTNVRYEWLVYYTKSGVLKQHAPDYSLLNNYTYKIENITVSSWTASTAYTKYPYEAVIPIQNIKESDTVEVMYSVPDADSNNYSPDGELYEGYIKIFSKVNTGITIPALIVTKIEL